MLKYIFCFLLIVAAGTAGAQSAPDTLLMVPGQDGPYFYHVVEARETIYSLSRRFGLEPRQLASFNGLTLKSSLKIYQLLKIPLTDSDLDQASATPPSGAIPLYHKVTRGETLFHISQLQGGVAVARVREWNGLKGNEVHPGDYLIVGWLKQEGAAEVAASPAPAAAAPSREAAAPDTKTGAAPPAEQTAAAVPAEEPVPDSGTSPAPAKASAAPAPKPAAAPAATAPSDGFLGEVIASENASRRSKTHKPQSGAMDSSGDAFSVSPPPAPPKAISGQLTEKPAAAGTTPAKTVTDNPAAEASVPAPPETQPATDEQAAAAPPVPEKVPETETPRTDSFAVMLNKVTGGAPAGAASPAAPPAAVSQPAADSAATAPPGAGTPAMVKSAFQSQFDQQTANGTRVEMKKGAAGWFKSNVKPGSGRYYALCNDLPRGTIVRVVNPLNQQSVLVKVLDVIPNQKDNYNLIIKLSDAARGDLGVTQSRFWCEINFPATEKK